MTMTLQEDIAANIRELLRLANRSQKGLAAHLKAIDLDIGESGLSRRLNGHQNFDTGELEAVAAYLELDPRVLVKPSADLGVWVLESGWLLRIRSRCVVHNAQPTLPGFDGGVWVAAAPLLDLTVPELVAA